MSLMRFGEISPADSNSTIEINGVFSVQLYGVSDMPILIIRIVVT